MKTLPNETSALEWKYPQSSRKKSPSGGNLLPTSGTIETPHSESFANKKEQESTRSSSFPEKSFQSGSDHIGSGHSPENLFSGMMFLFLGASMSFLAVLMAREGSWICFPLSGIASLFLSRWWAAMSSETTDGEEGR